MYCRTRAFVSLLATVLFLFLLVSPAQATPPAEHVDGMPADATAIGMSGDGEWVSWVDYTPPELFVHNLTTGVQTTVNLNITTGDDDLDFGNDAYPELSDDGSIIAVMADGPSGSRRPEIPLVLSPNGTEIARVVGTYFGDQAYFYDYFYIDGSGRYMIFTTDANYMRSELGGVQADTLTASGDLYNVYRFDTLTGDLELVPIRAGGRELNDYAYPLGISDGGRYVLFESAATDLPGANGDYHVYLRDMNSADITLVSVNESGALVSGLACCRTTADISSDGSRVVFTEDSDSSADGQDHTFLWTRGIGSVELSQVTDERGIRISGDGLWLTAADEAFSRLEIESGVTDPLPEISPGVTQSIDEPRISNDGQTVLFWDQDTARPPGEDGRWWLIRFDQLPPDVVAPQWPDGAVLNLSENSNNIDLNWPAASDDTAVTRYLVYRDDLEIAQLDGVTTSYTDSFDTSGTYSYKVEAEDAAGNLSTDGPGETIIVEYLPTLEIFITESITVTDEVLLLPSVIITVMETITVFDGELALPSATISLAENITIKDEIEARILPDPTPIIDITLPDGPLKPGVVFIADGHGFKPFTPVQAFLQSDPVLVGEEMADANGNVTFVITVPVDFPPGDHTLILLGQGFDGSERRLTAPVSVAEPDMIFGNGFE